MGVWDKDVMLTLPQQGATAISLSSAGSQKVIILRALASVQRVQSQHKLRLDRVVTSANNIIYYVFKNETMFVRVVLPSLLIFSHSHHRGCYHISSKDYVRFH